MAHWVLGQYGVAVRESDDSDRIGKKQTYRLLKNNFNSWTADPFPFEYNGELYIFAELFRFSDQKGYIGWCKKTKHGFSGWHPAIKEKFHMSFPNIFQIESEIFMCPEVNQSNELAIYRCVNFPDKWEKMSVLANGRFTDTVFYRKAGDVYGFTYTLDKNFKMFRYDDGKIIFSDSKPQTIGVDLERPAGKIVNIRPYGEVMISQIGFPEYGSGLVFKNFTLNWPDYKETELFKLYATDMNFDKNRKYTGMHTFNFSEHFTVVDVIYKQFRPVEFFFNALRKIKKIGCIVFEKLNK